MNKLIASLGLSIGACLCATPASAGIVVTFTPSAQHVNLGETIFVDVSIAGLGDEILAAFDWNFLYDGSVIGQNRSIDGTGSLNQLGVAWGQDALFLFDDLSLGNWGVQASAFAGNDDIAVHQDDDFLLARFAFSADSDGFSFFGLGESPDYQRNFVGLDPFSSLDVSVGSACIAVGTGTCATIPEPATYALAGLAMFAAFAPAAVRRRREHKG